MGVYPNLSSASTRLPRSISASTTFSSPLSLAQWSAVSPSASFAYTSAPASSNANATSSRALSIATFNLEPSPHLLTCNPLCICCWSRCTSPFRAPLFILIKRKVFSFAHHKAPNMDLKYVHGCGRLKKSLYSDHLASIKRSRPSPRLRPFTCVCLAHAISRKLHY